jgi:integrase
LHAGRTPRPDTRSDTRAGVTVKDLANAFLTSKKALVDNGELSPHTFAKYQTAAALIVTQFGKRRLTSDLAPGDFATLRKTMAAKWGFERLASMIQCVRSIFKYGHDADLLPSPMRFGPEFKRPGKRIQRLAKAARGANLFTADQVRQLIEAAGPALRAMVLLGINCGFGNSDCGNLPQSAVDLDAGWIDYPRPKTGVPRRCALWPETVAAIRAALACQPAPRKPENAALVFITKYGESWYKSDRNGPLTWEMKKLLRKLDIRGQSGLGFYTLRHVFRTVADESKDQPAVDFTMGHDVPHMSSVYRETISDERLRAVADHVRHWLFDEVKAAEQSAEWTPIPLQAIFPDVQETPDNLHLRMTYGLDKASYRQVVLTRGLLAKGWRDPYFYRGCVWLSPPNGKPRPGATSNEQHRQAGRAIRITKTGRFLLGW